ncbi:AraC family transcriptional regulator [Brevibacterium picturae]|uniref:AraC family transcriptional regulator n=1 Tax=Brevibacterium picturae TaxID=260553 RepID=A0ABN2CAG7_9MICO
MLSPQYMLYSSSVAVDHLSEILDLIAVRGVVSGGVAVNGRWVAESSVAEELKFCAIVRGEALLMTDGIEEPIPLGEGEVAILNARSWLSLRGGSEEGKAFRVEQPANGVITRLDASDPENSDIFIGGRIDLDAAGHELLLDALPPVAHIRTSSPSSSRVSGTIDRLFDEITSARAGADFAVREYSQVLILDVLRAFVDELAVPPGWLRLLGDDRLRPALDLIHERPEVTWGLNDLARASAMSRTAFAVRFREVAGMPPLTYLVRWRMLLARRELRSADSRMRLLALKLGYSSESSFSSAFKRNVGESPHRYRTRMLAQQAPSGTAAHV